MKRPWVGLEDFERYFASVWDECSYEVFWTSFGIAFLWDWNKNWPFPVLWPLLSFLNLLAYWVQHFHSIRGCRNWAITAAHPRLTSSVLTSEHVVPCSMAEHRQLNLELPLWTTLWVATWKGPYLAFSPVTGTEQVLLVRWSQLLG